MVARSHKYRTAAVAVICLCVGGVAYSAVIGHPESTQIQLSNINPKDKTVDEKIDLEKNNTNPDDGKASGKQEQNKETRTDTSKPENVPAKGDSGAKPDTELTSKNPRADHQPTKEEKSETDLETSTIPKPSEKPKEKNESQAERETQSKKDISSKENHAPSSDKNKTSTTQSTAAPDKDKQRIIPDTTNPQPSPKRPGSPRLSLADNPDYKQKYHSRPYGFSIATNISMSKRMLGTTKLEWWVENEKYLKKNPLGRRLSPGFQKIWNELQTHPADGTRLKNKCMDNYDRYNDKEYIDAFYFCRKDLIGRH